MAGDADRRLAARCRRQHGVFSRAQAAADGIAGSTYDWRVANGVYEERWPGVAAVAGLPDSREARWMAAVLFVGGDGVLARSSAAALHGLHVPRGGETHVVVSTRTFEHDQLVVHRTNRLPEHHRTVVAGIPATSVERTLCDIANDVSPSVLRRAIGDGVRHRMTTPAVLRATVAELGRFRGKRVLLPILDELSPHEAFTRNEFESLFVRLTTRAGIPPTAVNYPVRGATGARYELDVVYLPERLPVELDGRTWHGTELDRNDDRLRENDLVLAGWRSPLRFTWWDLTRRPESSTGQLRRALELIRSAA